MSSWKAPLLENRAPIHRRQLIQEAGVPPAPELIAEAVNVVVSISRTGHGRKVQEVARVDGWHPETGFKVGRIA